MLALQAIPCHTAMVCPLKLTFNADDDVHTNTMIAPDATQDRASTQMSLRLMCEDVCGGWRLVLAQSLKRVVGDGEWETGCSQWSYALWQALIACGSCCVFGFV